MVIQPTLCSDLKHVFIPYYILSLMKCLNLYESGASAIYDVDSSSSPPYIPSL